MGELPRLNFVKYGWAISVTTTGWTVPVNGLVPSAQTRTIGTLTTGTAQARNQAAVDTGIRRSDWSSSVCAAFGAVIVNMPSSNSALTSSTTISPGSRKRR